MRHLFGNRPTIGVLAGWQAYTGTIHSFLDHVYHGIHAAVRTLECNLLIGCGVDATYHGTNHTCLPLLLPGVDFVPVGDWNTDGLIFCAPLFSDKGMQYFQRLIDDGFPVVFAGDRLAGPSVVVDNEGGIHQAIDHLVGHGHRRIALIAGHNRLGGDSEARLRGYRTGLQKHGLRYDPDMVIYGNHMQDGGYQAANDLLQRKKHFTAVIASNDESALGVMDALRDAGLVVPHDVAVIGFDDRLESRAQIPLLTTVHHPMFELGYQSAQLVYQIIRGEKPPNTVTRIPTHLVVRESCGCLPGASSEAGQSAAASWMDGLTPFPFNLAKPFPASPAAPAYDSTVMKVAAIQQLDPLQTQEMNPASQIARTMTEKVYSEMLRMTRAEAEYLCNRLLDAFNLSLAQGNPTIFRQAVQQILGHVAAAGDDLFSFQQAISVLQESTSILQAASPGTLSNEQIDHMLHQARIAINEVTRGQYSRLQMRQIETSNQIGAMTSRFLTAETEQEIFEILNQTLISLGIQPAAVAFFEPEAEDTVAWSVLKNPLSSPLHQKRFATRQFPPPGLYPEDYPFQLAILPLIGQDGLIGFAAFDTDNLDPLGIITRQLVAAIRGVTLYQEAVAARKLAEEANYLKSRFLSMVSHELRTPLNMIIGLSNMMLEDGQPLSEQEFFVNRKDLERIYIGAQHLESLIRDVLDLARSDVGQLKLVFETIDLSEVLRDVSVIGEQLARDKELNWRFILAPDLPQVYGDRTRLRQVVLNLVANAVKFTTRGGVTLSALSRNGNIVVSVSDTGLGIPLEEQQAIFDEFRQSKRTTARGFGGLGLGLAICKRLVEMHGGEIGVTSSGEEGSGSTFYFSIPVIEQFASSEYSSSNDNDVPQILLLVKEPASGERLQGYLTRQGFQIEMHTVSQNRDWLVRLKSHLPDKVVLDLGLTSDYGWEILKVMKENPDTRDIPVLFYALENDQDSGAFLDLNILTKPINATELAEELVANGLAKGENSVGQLRPILVVDDDPDILDLHTRILESLASGYRVIQACSGCEALEIAQRERPELILLDLLMPEMDGFTVLETMQSNESLRGIPVIVITSQILTEEDLARLNCGMVRVLNKGMYSVQETFEHVKTALLRKRRPDTETQWLVFKAMAYICAHYKEPISRIDVAAHVGISERHLARCFQKEIGLAPITYLNRFRINQAKILIDSGEKNITRVAMEAGFSTGAYFSRVFKEEVGIAPRDYLRK